MFQLDPAVVESQLHTALLGRPLVYLASVQSTQEIVRAAARAGESEGLTVVAGQQTGGKGRAGRAWWSPPAGGLYLSLLLRPNLAGDWVPWLTMALALGAVEAIEQVCGVSVDIKWPNDLQWQGRKLAGILAEGAFTGGRLDYVIAGIGLNVAIDFSGRPDLADIAVSLDTAAGGPVDPATLLARLLERTEQHYRGIQAGHSPLPAWRNRLVTLGKPVQARTGDGRLLTGMASDVLPDGALRIDLEHGGYEVVRASDVTLREQGLD